MPILLGAIGLVLVICAINNTLGSNSGGTGLGDLVKRDFTGANNFLIWLVAIIVVGAFGYIPKFKPVAYSFFVLIFIAIVLSNKKNGTDVFQQFFNAIQGAGTSGGSGTNSSSSNGLDFSSISNAFQSFGNSSDANTASDFFNSLQSI